jgi:uncharacterized RDD family membrane protein YckC
VSSRADIISPAPLGRGRRVVDAVRTFGLAILWALSAGCMVLNALRDPYDAALEGTRRYGHNHEGALRDGLVVSLIELAVLYFVLRPWNKDGRPWLRVLALLLVFVPWTLLSAVLTMHSGGIVMIHLMWLLTVVLVLVVALVGSAAATLGRRSHPES